MVSVIVDLEILGAAQVARNGKEIISINELKEDILKSHDVSQEAFNYSFDYYSNRPKKLEKIYNDVITSLLEMER